MSGINHILARLAAYDKKVDGIVSEQIAASADAIMRQSNDLAPKLTGRLVASATVHRASNSEATVAYGADYAVYVHEDMQGRSAKFLERSLQQNTSPHFRATAGKLRRIR